MIFSNPTAFTAIQRNKFETIQSFRFIAALMVIILHSTFYTSERLQPGFPLYIQGVNGVSLFFTISGFVMIISSVNLQQEPRGWKIFAIKRIIRIVPIYWIITTYKLFVLLFSSSLIYHARLDPIYILKSYLFIPAKNSDGDFFPFLGVGWTLNFEMLFYSMFTLALALRVNLLFFFSVIFISLSVISTFKTPQWPDIGFYANTIVLDFLYGLIIAKLVLYKKKLAIHWAILFVLLGLIYLFAPTIGFISGQNKNSILVGIATFFVIYGAVSFEGSFVSTKIPRWSIYLGTASYSLYLIHPIVAPIVPTILNKLNFKWPLFSVGMSIIVATISGILFYKICENPLTKFLSKKIKKISSI